MLRLDVPQLSRVIGFLAQMEARLGRPAPMEVAWKAILAQERAVAVRETVPLNMTLCIVFEV